MRTYVWWKWNFVFVFNDFPTLFSMRRRLVKTQEEDGSLTSWSSLVLVQRFMFHCSCFDSIVTKIIFLSSYLSHAWTYVDYVIVHVELPNTKSMNKRNIFKQHVLEKKCTVIGAEAVPLVEINMFSLIQSRRWLH